MVIRRQSTALLRRMTSNIQFSSQSIQPSRLLRKSRNLNIIPAATIVNGSQILHLDTGAESALLRGWDDGVAVDEDEDGT